MTEQTSPPASQWERILATMVVGIVGLSVLSFFAIIIATWMGFERADFAAGLWPTISMMPLIGLPVGFLLILTLLVVSTKRRRQGWAPGERD